jgi:hypothetical protein
MRPLGGVNTARRTHLPTWAHAMRPYNAVSALEYRSPNDERLENKDTLSGCTTRNRTG